MPVGKILADLNPWSYARGSYPTFIGTVGGKAVFRTDGEANAFAWITDGTPEGTKPLAIGNWISPYVPELVALGTAGAHLFLLERNNGWENDAIVAIDAQGAVTRVVEEGDTWDFLYLDSPSEYRVAGRKLALALQTASFQNVLLFIDGDTLISSVAHTAGSTGVQLLGNIGSDLVFGAQDSGAQTTALWRSGGSPATTAPYATVPGWVGSDGAASGQSLVYFTLQSPDEIGTEVWATTGAPAGTTALTSLVDPGAQFGRFHVTGDRAYFLVTDATFGQEIFVSDGLPSGTRPVTAFGYHQPFGYGDLMVTLTEGKTFFVATDGVGSYQLWLAGDRPETTRSLAENVIFDSSQAWVASAGGSAFAATSSGDGNIDLIVSDGTEAGTHEVETGCASPCNFYPESLASTSSTFYFTAPSTNSEQPTLWAVRPPFDVAMPLFDALKEGPIIDYITPRAVSIVGEQLFFAAGQFVPGASGARGEPWVSFGTPATTSMIRRLGPMESSSKPSRFRAAGGALAFGVDYSSPNHAWLRPNAGAEVEEVQGAYETCLYYPHNDIYALASQFVLRDCQNGFWSFGLSPGPATRLTDLDSDNFDPSAANGEVVGLIRWSGSAYEAWRIGGAGPGAELAQVLDIEAGYLRLVVAGEEFLLVHDSDFGEELYSLGDDLSGFDPVSPVFQEVGTFIGSAELGRGFFSGSEDSGVTRVWTTDGSAPGTVPLFPGEGYGDLVDVARSGSDWFLLAYVDDSGPFQIQVWRTDGSAAGSRKLATVPFEDLMDESRIAALPDRVLFTRRSAEGVGELWSVPAEGGEATEVLPPGVSLRRSYPQLTVASGRFFFTACDADHGCELWVSDGSPETTRLFQDIRPGSASSNPEQLFALPNELVFAADDGLHGIEPWHVLFVGPNPCGEGSGALCLDGGRFQARAFWKAPVARTGDAGEAAMTPDTGGFWFFDDENVELILKAIDGSGFNGHEWIFYGALSNVEYSVDVTDSVTGEARRYFNPAGRFASGGDIFAFPRTDSATAPAAAPAAVEQASVQEAWSASPAGACAASGTTFCILGGRFAVEATWRDFEGRTGVGQAGSLTDDTGYFWFFDDANVELVVKAVDGTEFNGQFWIYYGALSNVEYVIRVTDTATGLLREYTNPLGKFGSFGDIVAFPAD